MDRLINPVYLKLTNKPVAETRDVNERGEVFVDFDADGNVIGVEILKDCDLEHRIPEPLKNLKFVWRGWYDSYDALNTPTLLDGENIVWQGDCYYSGECKEKIDKLREELRAACAKFRVSKDFSGSIESWDMEDQRTYSG